MFLACYSEGTEYICFGLYKTSANGESFHVNGATTYEASDFTGTAIGTGRNNTQMLVGVMGTTSAYVHDDSRIFMQTDEYAARMCDILTYTVNGVTYDDWFLPSRDELNLIYTELFNSGLGGFADGYYSLYWSSSEGYYATGAWLQAFNTGYQYYGDRLTYNRVRAVRAFLPGESCNHVWDNGTLTAEATCSGNGMKTYTCIRCNMTRVEIIPMVDHIYGPWEIVIVPTETEEGEKHRFCMECGHEETETISFRSIDQRLVGIWKESTDEDPVLVRLDENGEFRVFSRSSKSSDTFEYGGTWFVYDGLLTLDLDLTTFPADYISNLSQSKYIFMDDGPVPDTKYIMISSSADLPWQLNSEENLYSECGDSYYQVRSYERNQGIQNLTTTLFIDESLHYEGINTILDGMDNTIVIEEVSVWDAELVPGGALDAFAYEFIPIIDTYSTFCSSRFSVEENSLEFEGEILGFGGINNSFSRISESEWEQITAGNTTAVYAVGDIGPAGGHIFYDCDADNESGNADGLISTKVGWRYLEAAPADLRVVDGVPTVDSSLSGYSSSDPGYVFGYYRTSDNGRNLYVNGATTYSLSDCTGAQIGTGKRNTQLLVSAMGTEAYSWSSGSSKTGNYAAKLCEVLSYTVDDETFDDWFLPSPDELSKMYVNLHEAGLGGFASSFCYWSSCEYLNAYNAWTQDFDYGGQGISNRDNNYRVRAVRAF